MRVFAMALAASAAALVALSGGSASASTVDDAPVISGPPASVHHVTTSGYNGTLDWVTAQGLGNAEVNAAQWSATLPTGIYQVDAWIPKQFGTTYARYSIFHAGISDEVRLNQQDFGDQWVTLGTYSFDSAPGTVRATDAAGVAGSDLAWDAMRWTARDAIPSNIESDGAQTIVNDPDISGPSDFVTRFVGIGYRDDLLRTYAQGVNGQVQNSATWHAPVSAGTYSVEAFIPRQHAEADVTYTVTTAAGPVKQGISQSSFADKWASIGTYAFDSSGATVSMTDATGSVAQEIAWDAMRFIRQPDPPTPPGPGPGTSTTPTVTGAQDGKGDRDHDGVADGVDRCPTEPRGHLDSDHDGCPGPRSFVRAQRGPLLDFSGVSFLPLGARRAYRITQVRVARPKGSTVHIACAPCLFMHADRSGLHTSLPQRHGIRRTLLTGRVLRYGSALRVLVTRSAHIGRAYIIEFRKHSAPRRRDLCIVPPTNRPQRCPAS